MPIIDAYLVSLNGAEKTTFMHLYDVVRRAVPDVGETVSYGMPTFTYKGKALLAIVTNKKFLSLYPFCSLERLGLDFSAFETTKGSIHFTSANPLSDDLLRKIIGAKMRQIDHETN
jgi:uncharacterized protein YdhG (YjbR/CyaY superfamily)